MTTCLSGARDAPIRVCFRVDKASVSFETQSAQLRAHGALCTSTESTNRTYTNFGKSTLWRCCDYSSVTISVHGLCVGCTATKTCFSCMMMGAGVITERHCRVRH